ncbi:hypothetical protein [Myroides guanonis]|uniref:Uncharacterized protein n=1 Tax=Myroides guanonis TaxID=1150112 RepID=A0A1I3LBQ4_9FLAO|nr:hypothetical protein [Myroides guanonis]SFI81990.1 hypothetical protein SAMN04487893_101255 [Myroides guanonis]
MIKLYSKEKKESLNPDKKTIDFILKYSKEYTNRNKKTDLIH